MGPTTVLSVALGGAIGAVLRYLITLLIGGAVATLAVNIIGSFLMGCAFVYLSVKGLDTWQPFLMTGILGGFTTFSAFSLDVLKMAQGEHILGASAYIFGSILLSILACAVGVWLTKGILA